MLLKLMFYVDDPGNGGNSVYAHNLALALAGAGVDIVYVHSPNNPGNGSSDAAAREACGIRHVHLPYDTIADHFQAILDRREPERIMVAERPDLILFSDSVPQSTIGAKDAAAGLGIPSVTVKHLVTADNRWATAPSLRTMVERALDVSRLVVTVSRENRETLSRLFTADPSRLCVVHNSVPERFFTPRSMEARRALRAEWGAGDDTMVVFTTARVLPQKGYDLQVQTMARLKEAGELRNMLFVWAGDVESVCWDEVLVALMASGAAGSVRWLGRRSDIDRCLDAADVFFLPSRGEGMPLSMIEAMAKGVPSIATGISGIPEAMGDTGILLPDPNHEPAAMVSAAAAALTAWRDDPAERARKGAAAAERAATLFRSQRQLRDMIAVLAKALATPEEYASPGLLPIRPDRLFPFVYCFDQAVLGAGYDRSGGRHARRLDCRFPRIPMPSRDEAALIYNTALRVQGTRMLVAGAGCGWTLAHVRAAGGFLDVIDPTLVNPMVKESVVTVLTAIPTGEFQYTATVPDGIKNLLEGKAGQWSLLLLDADAFTVVTRLFLDAVLPHLADDAFILMVGAAHTESAPALARLAETGWNLRVYDTARALAVAWRGDVEPVAHIPDPAVVWDRPAHLAPYFSRAGAMS